MVSRVKPDDLKVGEQVERSEHPWASRTVARKIAHDHLQENPRAYSSGNKQAGREVVILNQNVRVVPPRKKKKVVPQDEQQQSNGLAWLPMNLRMWG